MAFLGRVLELYSKMIQVIEKIKLSFANKIGILTLAMFSSQMNQPSILIIQESQDG